MKFTYNNTLKFMTTYFEAFTAYAQDPQTTYKMHDYFNPDLECISYIPGVVHITSREMFLQLMSAHPSSHEKLTPKEIIIDEKRKIAVVLTQTEISDAFTGEVLVTQILLPVYWLVLDQDKSIKIKKIQIFGEGMPPGAIQVSDIFKKDPKMANFIT